MELKVVCNCGQKYKFDVEPVNQRMPFAVNCPACGVDGTPIANNLLAQMPPQPAAAPVMMSAPAPVAPAAPAGLRINRAAPPPAAAPPLAPPIPAATTATAATAQRASAVPKYMQTNAATSYNNFGLGILGAIIGAVVAFALMGGFTEFTGMKFPLLGTVEGAIIGFGARLLYRGTSSTLGAMSAAVAFFTIILTFFFFFSIITILLSGVISLLVGVSIAFKVAS
jgi:hypothetical protein